MPLEKWHQGTLWMQGCHKPPICVKKKAVSVKINKVWYAVYIYFHSVRLSPLEYKLHERKTVSLLEILVEIFIKSLLSTALHFTKDTHTQFIYCYLSTRHCSSALHVLTRLILKKTQ